MGLKWLKESNMEGEFSQVTRINNQSQKIVAKHDWEPPGFFDVSICYGHKGICLFYKNKPFSAFLGFYFPSCCQTFFSALQHFSCWPILILQFS